MRRRPRHTIPNRKLRPLVDLVATGWIDCIQNKLEDRSLARLVCPRKLGA